MKDGTKDKVEPGQEIKGAVKESLGRALHDANLEAEGAAEKAAAENQHKVDDLEKVEESKAASSML